GTSQVQTVMIGPRTHIENAFGGGGNDTIIGNNLNNVLDGMGGANWLTGGNNADQFVFNTPFASSFTTVADFTPSLDKIDLSASIFALSGVGQPLDPAMFQVGATFTTQGQRIEYTPANGWLTYDSNGSVAGGTHVHFMTLSALLNIHNTDF